MTSITPLGRKIGQKRGFDRNNTTRPKKCPVLYSPPCRKILRAHFEFKIRGKNEKLFCYHDFFIKVQDLSKN